jgi:SWI/SNF-related matrix-associated actin-dependent regulator of chromatin subfamily A3
MGVPATCSFLRRVMMRHTKEQKYTLTGLSLLELPKKHSHTIIIPFVGNEEAAYSKLEQYFSEQYNACKDSTHNGVNRHLIRLLSMVKDLQLACSGGSLPERLLEIVRSSPADVQKASALAVQALIEGRKDALEGEYGECPICLDLMEKPYSTECDHVFCFECIVGLINSSMMGCAGCPMCRRSLSLTNIRPAPALPPVPKQGLPALPMAPPAAEELDEEYNEGELDEDPVPMEEVNDTAAAAAGEEEMNRLGKEGEKAEIAGEEGEGKGEGEKFGEDKDKAADSDMLGATGLMTSKLNRLVEELRRVQAADSTAKCLVFSQFTQTLTWLQIELPKYDFSFRTLLGSMTMANRAKALADFQNDPPTSVFLLSMRAGAVGINLTQANHVFIMDPCLNVALEDQVSVQV